MYPSRESVAILIDIAITITVLILTIVVLTSLLLLLLSLLFMMLLSLLLLLIQAVLGRASTYEDSVRWARCLSEMVQQAGQLCNESAKAAYVEVSSRLQVSVSLIVISKL